MVGPPTLTIITPSYAPDLELCRDLRASLVRHAAPTTAHRIIVPRRDLHRFAPLAELGATVVDVDSVMPSQLRKAPRMNMWVNVESPFPPIRGWIAQQLVKLAAAASAETDIALLVDSDVEFIRAVDGLTFAPCGRLPLYRLADAVSDALPRHRLWHDTARRLLGLAPTTASRLPDYICWPCAWDPAIVRAMLRRIEYATGRSWATSIGRELHFSEMILYGVYVEEMLGTALSGTVDGMRCRVHPDEIPLDGDGLDQFLSEVAETDVAVMVSAKSGTGLEQRRAAMRRLTARLG
ncbi:DUF6492 family protein [Agromyces allii]|uniref:DUF6492 family protein n=1 Tax=Agromyces allii TaxID=393607 RepID=A0ABP5C359_9MICO|nr:DUF6492 family protein [Agromyces allii]